jgi:isopentenyl phosphate kinase
MSKELMFLKLGGSLITDKAQTATARPERIAQLVAEIAAAHGENPDLRLLLGHGSGSFGHVPAKQHGTREGVRGEAGWRGFAEVWAQAVALNRILIDALLAVGLPAIAFPPSASATAHDGALAKWDAAPIQSALDAGLLPVVYGDVVFDDVRGGTILSTEDLFVHLAPHLKPQRVLLAALEPVYANYEMRRSVIAEINPRKLDELQGALGGAEAPDVTGGMAGKVARMLALAASTPGCEVRIFAGVEPGSLAAALRGDPLGTLIRSSES